MIFTEILLVMLGGSIGAAMRYLIGIWSANHLGINFPYATLLVNVAGCFLMGIIMTFMTERMPLNTPARLLLTTGFLGALTTFSSFSYETLHLVEIRMSFYAIINIIANVISGLGAAWLGTALVRIL